MKRPVLAIGLVLLLSLATMPVDADEARIDRPLVVYDEVAAMAGLRVTQSPEVAEQDLRTAILGLYDLMGAVPTPRGLATLDARLAAVPHEVQAPVAGLLTAMNEAARLRHAAFADVTVEEARYAYHRTLSDAPLTADEEAHLATIAAKVDRDAMATAGRIVLEATAEARAALGASSVAMAGGVSFVDPLGSVEIADVTDDLHAEDRTLLIDLGGDDEWANNAGSVFPDFIIQAFPGCITTGGLDCSPLAAKRNAPTTESLFGRPCSVDAAEAALVAYGKSEDLDEQADEQVARPNPSGFAFWAAGNAPGWADETATTADPKTGCVPQDADDVGPWADDFVEKGILTDGDEHIVAVGLDLGAGTDRFAPPKGFNDINNGNNGPGCDTTDMGEDGKIWERNLTAGGAFAGVGVLWDDGGADFYGGRSLTQGTGHVGGVGILVDEGLAADVYEGVRLAQGAAIFAALGLQYDEGGDDQYLMINDVPFFNEFEHFIGCDVSTRDGQGRANFNAVAALVDLAGDDVYFVQDHDDDIPGASRDDPTTTQGSTGTRLNIGPSPVNDLAALGLGLLWDRGGTDSYTRDGRADGVTDLSGVFVDEE